MRQKHLLVLLLLALAAGGALRISQRAGLARPAAGHEFVTDIDSWQRTDRERVVTSPYDFSLAGDLTRIPLQLGDWTGVDVPQTNLEVAILLDPEQYVYRLYTRPDGRSLWLSLIGSRKSKSFHSPQICYDADGWQTDAGSEALALPTGELYALRVRAQKAYGAGALAEQMVLYFYLWPGYARDLQDGVVLLKITAPLAGSRAESLAAAQEFVGLLFTAARE